MAGQVTIVTGGASGLGRHYCEALVAAGGRVVVADILEQQAVLVAEELNGGTDRRAVAVGVDVTSEEAVQSMVDVAVDAFGTVDVLLNNAGAYPHEAIEDISYHSWRAVLSTNLDSVFLCSRAVLPVMRAQGSGKIINVCTNLVWVGLAGMSHYIAAKAGVVGFTRALAREVGAAGITVNALAPGAVPPARERLSDAARQSIASIIDYQCVQRPERVDDLVGVLLFLVSPAADFLSGQVITVDGGLTFH